MSHGHDHENTVPRPALYLAGMFIAGCLALTTATSLGYLERQAVPSVARAEADVSPAIERALSFADQDDGSVLVTDAESGETVALIETETQSGGFVRGVMRSMARERRMHGIGAEPPFDLTLWENGSISLTDSATGRSVELGAFGSDNRAVFIAMLENGGVS